MNTLSKLIISIPANEFTDDLFTETRLGETLPDYVNLGAGCPLIYAIIDDLVGGIVK